MQIIVTGHGNFASGIESTVKLLAGKIQGVSYIDFTEDMSEDDIAAKLSEQLSEDSSTVFFCDLLGGTPYKQAALLQANNSDKDIAVICGCNVGSLLENGLVGLDKFKDADELATKLMDSAKAGIRQFGKSSTKVAAQAQEPEDDGI